MCLAFPLLDLVVAQTLGSCGAPGPFLTQEQSTSLNSAGGYWRTLVPAPASYVAGSLQCRQVPGPTLDAVGYRYW